MNDVLKTSALTGSEMQDIRANIPPVPLRDVTIPADSDDEEAKQDFLLKRKNSFGERAPHCQTKPNTGEKATRFCHQYGASRGRERETAAGDCIRERSTKEQDVE